MKSGWPDIPLAARVALVVTLLMVLLGVLASQQVLATLGRVQTERIRELATAHVEALSVALGPLVLRQDVWEIYDTLERARSASEARRIVFTAVANSDGNVVAASDPARAPVGSPFVALASGATGLGDLALNPGQTGLKLVAPLVYQGRQVGQLMSELDVTDLIAERARVTRLLIFWNAAATAALVLIGVLATRRMLAPLGHLTERMSASAEAPRPIPEAELPARRTEFGRLARSYNTMARAVREKAETERRLADRERFVSLGRLASSLAHEINNPLGGLLNATDTIRKFADDPKAVKTSADILDRGLRHLRDVAGATLEQNRLDRSGQVARIEDFEDLRLLIEPEIRRRNQHLTWEVNVSDSELSRLPAAPLRQIALNLLLNAAAAAPRGGQVGLRAKAADGNLRLAVSDNGPGLSGAARKRLLSSGPFEPGGGVGLRVVHDLVEELGGRITTGPRAGRNTVEAVLPIDRAEGTPDA